MTAESEDPSKTGKVGLRVMDPYNTMIGGISKRIWKWKRLLMAVSVSPTVASLMVNIEGGRENPRIRKMTEAIMAEGNVVFTIDRI